MLKDKITATFYNDVHAKISATSAGILQELAEYLHLKFQTPILCQHTGIKHGMV